MSIKHTRRVGLLLGVSVLIVAGVVAASSLAAGSNRHAAGPEKTGVGAGWWAGYRSNAPVHAEEIVLDEAGNAYISESVDSGTVESVSADELVIREGTESTPYGIVKLKIPAAAMISRDGSEAALPELEAGDFVTVVQSTDGTSVCGGSGAPRWSGPGAWGPGKEGWSGGPPWSRGGGPGPFRFFGS